jgi:hypothetical protein
MIITPSSPPPIFRIVSSLITEQTPSSPNDPHYSTSLKYTLAVPNLLFIPRK